MIDDPTIRDVLKEMDAEVAAATAANIPQQHMQQHHMQHMQQQGVGHASVHPPHPGYHMQAPGQFAMIGMGGHGGFQMDLAKRALFAAVLAALLFHPILEEMLERRIPILSTSDLYMTLARVFLLAVIFYALMVKLDL